MIEGVEHEHRGLVGLVSLQLAFPRTWSGRLHGDDPHVVSLGSRCLEQREDGREYRHDHPDGYGCDRRV